MKDSVERVSIFERQLFDLARGQSDAQSASTYLHCILHVTCRGNWH
jgi:hypothetical protein